MFVDSDKVIFHIDVNSAFLSWEAVYRLHELGETVDLRKIPSAVGGDMSKRHGIILAKSIPAKRYNIKTGESIVEAKNKCPNLVLVPPNHSLYKECSKEFIDILYQYSPDVEQFSIDEAFVDMTGTKKLWGEPIETANKLRQQIYDQLGFTVNVGVSDNKLLAKMASDFKKPNLVHTLFKNEIEEKMWPLPVSELFYVGKATFKALHNLGIKTIGDLANTDIKILKSFLKKHGEIIWSFANGIDTSIVEPVAPDNKGYGNSTTISFDVTDPGIAKMTLLELSENVANRLRKDNVKAEVISVSIKYSDFSVKSHQMTLDCATNITKEIHSIACKLFDQLWDGSSIRLLGVNTGHVKSDSNRQISLFDNTDYEKLERLDKAIDNIREKYGNDSIKRAVFLNRFKDK